MSPKKPKTKKPRLPFYLKPLTKEQVEAFVEEVKWKQYLKKWEKENTIDFDEIVRGSYFKK